MRKSTGRYGGKVYEDRSPLALMRAALAQRGGRVDLSSVRTRRENAAVAARRAGARGVSAVGLDYVDRLTNYQEQNGPPYKMTPRQRRRMDHKAHHQEAKARRAIAERRTDDKLATLRAALRGAA